MSLGLSLDSIKLHDPFWLAWQQAFLDNGLLHQYRQCEETGRFENFRRVARGEQSGHEGYTYNDSDVYKWLEAASYALAQDPDWEGADKVDEVIGIVADAQAPDGYIGTPFQLGHMDQRWRALTSRHEMYCIGHLIEAGVAHHAATGKSHLLDVAIRTANHVVDTFGPRKRKGYCGHEEIELAFCRLSETTNDPKYKELAKWMVEMRGSRPSPFLQEFDEPVGKELNKNYEPLVFVKGEYDGAYFQDDKPLAQQSEAVGHAVRAMYLFCGAADACEDPGIQRTLTTIWSNLVRKRMYVTGGIGSAGRNEGFTRDYDLPNREAYAETCAAIGLVFWAARMSRLTGESQYADVMELALYNAALSGVNLSADRYYYVNPLESRGDHVREPWFGCACCPPNIARLVMSVQQYAAHRLGGGLTIDLPLSADYTFDAGGSRAVVSVRSNYPWKGDVTIQVEEGGPLPLRIRLPNWRESYHAELNGKGADKVDRGYLAVDEMRSGDTLVLSIESKPFWLACDPMVADNIGRAALQNGPLVYCLEEADLGSPVHLFTADTSASVDEVDSPDPRMRTSLNVMGRLAQPGSVPRLYSTELHSVTESVTARFVPYFTWSNRAPGSMAVWLRT